MKIKVIYSSKRAPMDHKLPMDALHCGYQIDPMLLTHALRCVSTNMCVRKLKFSMLHQKH